MANWRQEYFAALGIRDEREKVNTALYDAYTRLADRTARVAASHQDQLPLQSQTQSTSQSSISPKVPSRKPSEQGPSTPDALAAARADLSAAQRSRAELQEQLTRTSTELEKLKKKTVQDSRRITVLEGERTHLSLRLRDRDEELRGKAKLLDDLQDELASLNLQLNMAEDRSSKLQRENQELVDRWMARMKKEAEAMNDASKYS
ncbi:autophagy protein Apg16, putative [Paecilomyces variotii No. 5]|uniref:Autophagy protein Apg16, putative n=1 Tax=Byssochlamys spectabilis (strain No. 5 / NBRC 109023) TaxID=1356009 RepID=V5I521_BYSSN|nr:autophagy protein Apg16, putative [Paecilomyces variotii No. 5]